MARDPGSRRNAHALDAQACDLVELPAGAAKTAVRCARVRAQRLPADCAAVPPARSRHEPAVAHDVEARLSTVVAPGVAARYLVDRVHRLSVNGTANPVVSPTINSERGKHPTRGRASGAGGTRARTSERTRDEDVSGQDTDGPSTRSSSPSRVRCPCTRRSRRSRATPWWYAWPCPTPVSVSRTRPSGGCFSRSRRRIARRHGGSAGPVSGWLSRSSWSS